VRADLELVAALLVDMRAAQDGELLDLVRQRDRPAHLRAGPLGRVDDLRGAGVEHAVVEGLQPDPDVLARKCHLFLPFAAFSREVEAGGSRVPRRTRSLLTR